MPVTIMADSACDLSPSEAAAAGIELVPILVRFGDRTYRDGIDLRLADFYGRLAAEPVLPVTEPPPQTAFEEAFTRSASGSNRVVCIVVSSKVSKVYETATAAAQSVPGVTVVDSKTLSAGFGLLATGAARFAKSGVDAETILAALDAWIASQHGYAIYPDLRFLQKSGRINKAQLLLGSMMHVFPVTRVGRDGALEGETTVKSWDQAKTMVASVAARKIEHPAKTRVAVTHTYAPELAQFVAAELQKRLSAPLKELTIHSAGPTIGSNVGPGAAGIFMLEE